MSREPSSNANRLRSAGLPAVVPDAPEPPKPERPKVMRVRVEPVTPKPQTQPGRADYEMRRRRALQKLQTTTEALSAEERTLVRGFRLSGGAGPDAERAERARLEREVRGR